MAVRQILQLGNPGLRVMCTPVRSFEAMNLGALRDDLRDTLDDVRKRRGFGRAIAAPQIGRPERVIFLGGDSPLLLVNPAIIQRSRKRITLWDDCFSFPDILVKVKRNLAIDVRYQDSDGKRRTLHAEGSLSELLQHEIDHLDGVLAIDRAIDTRHIVLRSEYEKLQASGERAY